MLFAYSVYKKCVGDHIWPTSYLQELIYFDNTYAVGPKLEIAKKKNFLVYKNRS